MKKFLAVLAAQAILATSSFAYFNEVRPIDTFGLTNAWSVGLGIETFKPKEKQFNSQDTLINGSLRYFATNAVALELAYGEWSHSFSGANAGKAKIRPLTFGVNWYPWQSLNDRGLRGDQSLSLFSVSAGIGSYDFDWNLKNKVANGDYNKKNIGFYIGAGYEYFFTRNLSGNIQVKAHNCDVKDARPATINGAAVADRNVDLTNVTIGAGLSWAFR